MERPSPEAVQLASNLMSAVRNMTYSDSVNLIATSLDAARISGIETERIRWGQISSN